MLSHFSHVQLFATLWTVAHQAPLSLGFSRQEHWSGVPLPSPAVTLETKSISIHVDHFFFKKLLLNEAHKPWYLSKKSL